MIQNSVLQGKWVSINLNSRQRSFSFIYENTIQIEQPHFLCWQLCGRMQNSVHLSSGLREFGNRILQCSLYRHKFLNYLESHGNVFGVVNLDPSIEKLLWNRHTNRHDNIFAEYDQTYFQPIRKYLFWCSTRMDHFLYIFTVVQFWIVTLKAEQNFELQGKYSRHDDKNNFLNVLEMLLPLRIWNSYPH